MHPQIKAISNTIKFKNGMVSFDMTSAEHSPMGNILFFMYYRSNIVDLVSDHTYSFPHNGGVHSFSYNGPWRDAVEFIELLKELYLARPFHAHPESQVVANELSYISQDIIAAAR